MKKCNNISIVLSISTIFSLVLAIMGMSYVFCECSDKPSCRVAPKLCSGIYIVLHLSCCSPWSLCKVRGLRALACRCDSFSVSLMKEERQQSNTAEDFSTLLCLSYY